MRAVSLNIPHPDNPLFGTTCPKKPSYVGETPCPGHGLPREKILADSQTAELGLGHRVPSHEAPDYFISGKLMNIDCIVGNENDMRAKIVNLVHERFPDELKRDFYLNNLSVRFGPHDVFEAVECPSGHLFAHTTFSVSIWGYRHPIDILALRKTILSSSIVQTTQKGLSQILNQEVEAVVYLA
jgi:hypothetical protein